MPRHVRQTKERWHRDPATTMKDGFTYAQNFTHPLYQINLIRRLLIKWALRSRYGVIGYYTISCQTDKGTVA